ncbi:MAG: tyrosine-type recombinase/integrase [Burkholderiaceae bacterium]
MAKNSSSSKAALTERNLLSRQPGAHSDTGSGGVPGLILRVSHAGGRYWVYKYMLDRKRREMGLGSLADVRTLEDARDLARAARRLKQAGLDPLEQRHRQDAERRQVAEWTFRKTAAAVHETLSPSWRNAKHAAQWINTLSTYAFPLLGERSVGSIGVADVLSVLRPIWQEKPETARRVRQRVDSVMRWAEAHGHADKNPVPAAVELLPKQRMKAEHHAAMPASEVPGFYSALASADPVAGNLALRFAILTAARSGEVRGAAWSEIDERERIWTVPPERMKAGREHRVPLSEQALAVLEAAKALGGEPLVFPSPTSRGRRPLSDMTLGASLKRRGLPFTVHGFRSSFRDWCAESGVSREVAERCLAHSIRSQTEAAYNRTDLLDARRPVMDGWSAYLLGAIGHD